MVSFLVRPVARRGRGGWRGDDCMALLSGGAWGVEIAVAGATVLSVQNIARISAGAATEDNVKLNIRNSR